MNNTFHQANPDHYVISLAGSILPEAVASFNGQLQQALQAKSAAVIITAKTSSSFVRPLCAFF